MTNRQQVLALPELLEHILLQLPMRDLLLSQKICKDWKHAIESSPSIQRALCFAPGTQADVDELRNDENILTIFTDAGIAPNPLLLDYRVSELDDDGNEIPFATVVRLDLRHILPEASCRQMKSYWEDGFSSYGYMSWETLEEPFIDEVKLCVDHEATFGNLIDQFTTSVQRIEREGRRGFTWSEGEVGLSLGWGDGEEYYSDEDNEGQGENGDGEDQGGPEDQHG
ncbi:hypothetical protein LTR56_003811 [Elasticomyces elasticus]|nr:hypothetical protein LTR56_003811 [Elasticomyces elasticus]KAK4928715.1 hypothetical protein LTR49_004524 [Elasticomyces elasticus]KAK5766657.1 hypothetical protein LTS12_003276 [Elasticomyces elasticus]